MPLVLYGQYPRSEDLVQATRDYDRQRISLKALENIRQHDRIKLRELQKGFPYLSPGLFHWDDLLRPFAQITSNTHTGPLTRFFETNTFWRVLELKGPFRLQEECKEDWIQKAFFPDTVFNKQDPLVFTLPFLFLFRDFSRGFSLKHIEQLLFALATSLGHLGMLVFFEPTFGWRPITQEEKTHAKIFLEKLKENTTLPIVITQCFFPIPQEDINFLFDLPVDGIGIDFYNNTLHETLQNFPQEKRLLAGILHTDSPLLEERGKVENFLSTIQRYVPQENLDFTVAGPAEMLPRHIMDQKVRLFKEMILNA